LPSPTWKNDTKLAETRLLWDLNDDITTYFAKLEKIEDELDELHIEWPTSIKITKAVNQMYTSNQFKKQGTREWEKKPAEEKHGYIVKHSLLGCLMTTRDSATPREIITDSRARPTSSRRRKTKSPSTSTRKFATTCAN